MKVRYTQPAGSFAPGPAAAPPLQQQAPYANGSYGGAGQHQGNGGPPPPQGPLQELPPRLAPQPQPHQPPPQQPTPTQVAPSRPPAYQVRSTIADMNEPYSRRRLARYACRPRLLMTNAAALSGHCLVTPAYSIDATDCGPEWPCPPHTA